MIIEFVMDKIDCLRGRHQIAQMTTGIDPTYGCINCPKTWSWGALEARRAKR